MLPTAWVARTMTSSWMIRRASGRRRASAAASGAGLAVPVMLETEDWEPGLSKLQQPGNRGYGRRDDDRVDEDAPLHGI